MKVWTLNPQESVPKEVIVPQQTHGNTIIEICTGQENLTDCDGLWTRDDRFLLGIKTADCAPVCFQDSEKFGILHIGWRGLVNGIGEKMQQIFTSPHTTVHIGPILPQFEIQKDFCFDELQAKFGNQFFIFQEEKIIFLFQKALQSLSPKAQFDPRSTFDTPSLASWRRDRNDLRNTTVIGKL